VQLVVRTLRVLRQLGEVREGAGLNDLSAQLGIPAPTLHRLLAVLADEGFVVRASDKRYALGHAALALANGARRLDEAARTHLRDLADLTGETVFVTELVGDRAVCTVLMESTKPLRLTVKLGQELPLHAAASARTLLAQLGDTEVERLLARHELTAYTPTSPADHETVRRHLRAIHENGFDVCNEELDPNVVAISAPIDTGGRFSPASITVAAPRERLSLALRQKWSAALVRAATAIAADMGARRPSTPAGHDPKGTLQP
jgi:DNA-binding IclR family transcriptional regulator